MLDIFKLKKQWLLNNGFREYTYKGVKYFELKGSRYSEETIKNTPIIVFMKLKQYKEGKIKWEEFENIKGGTKI